jgi:hypothetical protein
VPRFSTCCYMLGNSCGCIALIKALQMKIIPIESIYMHHISKPNGNELSSFGENTRIIKGWKNLKNFEITLDTCLLEYLLHNFLNHSNDRSYFIPHCINCLPLAPTEFMKSFRPEEQQRVT